MQPSKARSFFPALESLRGIAALTVVLFHINWQTHFRGLRFIDNGYLMVDFFFILSGFVIFHAYGGKLGSFDATKQFFFTRVGRLYPLHLAVLLAFLVWECAKWAEVRWGTLPVADEGNTPSLFFANLILAQALGFSKHPAWNVPSWSISAEFYTCLIFAFVALARPGRRAWLLISAVFAAIGLAVSWHYVGSLSAVGKLVLFRCLLGFFCGVIVWHLHAALGSRWRNITVLQLGSGLLVVLFLSVKRMGLSDFWTVPMFMAVILFTALRSSASILDVPFVAWLGKISYSIYLTHYFIREVFDQVLYFKVPRKAYFQTGKWTGDLLAAFFVLLVLATSNFTFRYVEDPCRRFARQWAAKSRQDRWQAVSAAGD